MHFKHHYLLAKHQLNVLSNNIESEELSEGSYIVNPTTQRSWRIEPVL